QVVDKDNDLDELRERNKELVSKLEKKEKQNEELQETLNQTVRELLKSRTEIADLNEDMNLVKMELSGILEKNEELAKETELRIAELKAENDMNNLRIN
ncbi:hypothetical protein PENTCL1PPCAC_8391, partial [Pristionchus entomophagus]